VVNTCFSIFTGHASASKAYLIFPTTIAVLVGSIITADSLVTVASRKFNGNKISKDVSSK
jgi:hypothetical protein